MVYTEKQILTKSPCLLHISWQRLIGVISTGNSCPVTGKVTNPIALDTLESFMKGVLEARLPSLPAVPANGCSQIAKTSRVRAVPVYDILGCASSHIIIDQE